MTGWPLACLHSVAFPSDNEQSAIEKSGGRKAILNVSSEEILSHDSCNENSTVSIVSSMLGMAPGAVGGTCVLVWLAIK